MENDARVRELLREYPGHQPEFACSIAVGSAEALWAELDLSLVPRVIRLEVSLPGQSGRAALPERRRRLPGTNIIPQTMHDDSERIFQALRAGATSYVIKNATSLPQYKQAILDVLAGGAALSPSVARKALQHFQPASSQQPALLSAREQQVLQGLVEGLSEKQVAARLTLSPDTVHTYVKRLYDKLHVSSHHELLSRTMRGNRQQVRAGHDGRGRPATAQGVERHQSGAVVAVRVVGGAHPEQAVGRLHQHAQHQAAEQGVGLPGRAGRLRRGHAPVQCQSQHQHDPTPTPVPHGHKVRSGLPDAADEVYECSAGPPCSPNLSGY